MVEPSEGCAGATLAGLVVTDDYGLLARLRLSRCFVKPSFAEALPTALTLPTTQTRLAPRPHQERDESPWPRSTVYYI